MTTPTKEEKNEFENMVIYNIRQMYKRKYYPRFLVTRLLANTDTVKAIEALMDTDRIPYGLSRLNKMEDGLKLCMEKLVLSPKWKHLFSINAVKIAEKRLEKIAKRRKR